MLAGGGIEPEAQKVQMLDETRTATASFAFLFFRLSNRLNFWLRRGLKELAISKHV